ncbi:unnamed protein product [Sphagnum tenellum]
MIRFEDSRAEIEKLIHEGRRILFTVKRKQTFNTYIKRANDFTDEGAFYLNSAKEWDSSDKKPPSPATIRIERTEAEGQLMKPPKKRKTTRTFSTASQYFSEGLETVSATNGEDETHPSETQAAAVQEPNDGEEGGSEDNNVDDCRDLHQSWASEVDKESLYAEGERLRTDSPTRARIKYERTPQRYDARHTRWRQQLKGLQRVLRSAGAIVDTGHDCPDRRKTLARRHSKKSQHRKRSQNQRKVRNHRRPNGSARNRVERTVPGPDVLQMGRHRSREVRKPARRT